MFLFVVIVKHQTLLPPPPPLPPPKKYTKTASILIILQLVEAVEAIFLKHFSNTNKSLLIKFTLHPPPPHEI